MSESFKSPLAVRLAALGGVLASLTAMSDMMLESTWRLDFSELSTATGTPDLGIVEKTWSIDLIPGHITTDTSTRDYPTAEELEDVDRLFNSEKFTFKRTASMVALAASLGAMIARGNIVVSEKFADHFFLVSATAGTALLYEQFLSVYDSMTVANGLQWGGGSLAATATSIRTALKIRHAARA